MLIFFQEASANGRFVAPMVLEIHNLWVQALDLSGFGCGFVLGEGAKAYLGL